MSDNRKEIKKKIKAYCDLGNRCNIRSGNYFNKGFDMDKKPSISYKTAESYNISVDKDGIIKNFSLSVKRFIFKFIFDHIHANPNISNGNLIVAIINELKKTKYISDIEEFNFKVNSSKYMFSIKNLLNDLIIIIHEMINWNNPINITALSTNIFKKYDFLTTYKEINSIRRVLTQIINHLNTFTDICINRREFIREKTKIIQFSQEEKDFLQSFYPNFIHSHNNKWTWIKDNDDIRNYLLYIIYPYFFIDSNLIYNDFINLGFNHFLNYIYKLDHKKYAFNIIKKYTLNFNLIDLETLIGKSETTKRMQTAKNRFKDEEINQKSIKHIEDNKIELHKSKIEKQESLSMLDYEERFLSIGTEKELMTKIFSILLPYIKHHECRQNNRNDAYIEVIISQIFHNEAEQNGFFFSNRYFFNAINSGKTEHFTMESIDRIRFFMKYSPIFNENIREEVLSALDSYISPLDTRTILTKTDISKRNLNEFNLIKEIQINYFKKKKEYISFGKLGELITENRKIFTSHFTKDYFFHPFTIYQIESWIENNFKEDLSYFNNLISQWRKDNNDLSIYALHKKPFRDMVFSILTLYTKTYNELISVAGLDRLMNEMGIITQEFFTRRVLYELRNKGYKMDDSNINLMKYFLDIIFSLNSIEANELNAKVINYENIPRTRKLRHSIMFLHLHKYQIKTLLDITLGLDIMLCTFFSDEELTLSAFNGGISRHHLDFDPEYNFIFEQFSNNEKTFIKFKLIPFRFLSSHNFFHNMGKEIRLISTDIAKARIEHIYSFYKMDYNNTLSRDYYIKLFIDLFDKRTDYINYYEENMFIWNNFNEIGHDVSISENIIIEFVDRWILFKENINKEEIWYNSFYPQFYNLKYIPFIQKIEDYKITRLSGKISAFNEWFITKYLPNEIFP